MTLSDLHWLSEIFSDTKHRAASMRQLSYLCNLRATRSWTCIWSVARIAWKIESEKFRPRWGCGGIRPVDCFKSTAAVDADLQIHNDLSYRRETARRFVSLNILLSHSRSFQMTLLSRPYVKSLLQGVSKNRTATINMITNSQSSVTIFSKERPYSIIHWLR